MNNLFSLKKTHYIIPALVTGGVVLAAINFNSQPLFENLDDFVLFAQGGVSLEEGVQVSSGDLGSNKTIDINKTSIINGNLFADQVTLDKDVIINGNVSFNEPKTKKETQIFGSTTTPVSLPIAKLPEIPDFQPGIQDLIFKGKDNTLTAGSFRNITLEKDSRLVLLGGVYNLSRLFLGENSTLIFATSTTLNLQQELKGQQRVSILPEANTTPDDLVVNYLGKKGKQKGQGIEPILFGKNSFLNFKLLAPEADVHIGETTTLRGQVLAKRVRVGKESILSREEVFEKESDITKVVEEEGIRFIVNEIVILFKEGVTISDLLVIASIVDGRVTGFLPDLDMGKIEVFANTVEELNSLINLIKDSNNPLIEEVFPNVLIL